MLPALRKLCIRWFGSRCASLREAVASLMMFFWRSGRLIEMKYEHLGINELRGTEPSFRQVTIETIPDNVLLNIFRHYLSLSPQIWPTLTHVCRSWRHIVLTSPLGLDLRLYCTYGTPFLKTLDLWPALPIVVLYLESSTLVPEDEDDIVAALKHSDRVSSIGLTITSSLLVKLFAIENAFSELEELVLRSLDNVQLLLPSVFRWGSRLRSLHLTGIAVPALPQLLSPSRGLVDLTLHEVPNVGYFSPDAFAQTLSGMTHLRSLSLHFISFPSRRNSFGPLPQSGKRIVLPALTHLSYRGISRYLDSLVARIDAPRLGDVDITFFSQPTLDASQLGRFIERIEMQTPLSRANIQISAHAIFILFADSSNSKSLQLHMSCTRLDWQLSFIVQVCGHFSPFIFRVEDLRIDGTQSSSEQGDMYQEQWLQLIRAFNGAKDFRVAGELATDILCALGPADGGHTAVLPALRQLHVENPLSMQGPLWDALHSLIISRSISGSPVVFNAPSYQCHLCVSGFILHSALKRHLQVKHAHRFVCLYCGDFVCMSGRNRLFREHLESKHPDVVYNDALTSNPL